MIKSVAERLLGGTGLGWLDFARDPNMPAIWGGPFNGQRCRQRIVFDLLYAFPIKAIVETGTYRGTTTALFAATALPVYTTEAHRRYYSYSRLHFLFRRSSIHIHRADSRSFLRQLGDDPSVPKGDVFFYLDAHWGADLPLREELEIIFSKWESPIVMVDDFCVPNSGYTWDDYGEQGRLDLGYIDSVVSSRKLSAFFPAADASAETGSKRGSVVLCGEEAGVTIEAQIKSLLRGSAPHGNACGATRAL